MKIQKISKSFFYSFAALTGALALSACGGGGGGSSSNNNTPVGTASVPAYSMAGQTDTSFATNGWTATPNVNTDQAVALGVQSTGKILLVYSDTTSVTNPLPSTTTVYYLVRYNADGSRDMTFGSSGSVTACTETTSFFFPTGCAISGITVQKDDKIILTVVQESVLLSDAFTRYSAEGAVDTTYGTNGTTSSISGGVAAAAIDPVTGDLMAAGSMIFPTPGAFVARFTTTGVLDTTFGSMNSGILNLASITGFTGTPNFSAGTINPTNGLFLAAGSVGSDELAGEVSSSGTLNSSFGTSGISSVTGFTAIYGIAVQSDGKIVLAGVSSGGIRLARLLADGQPDSAYGSSGSYTWSFTAPASAFFKKLFIDGNDEAIAVANTVNASMINTPEAIRVTNAGALDTIFASSGLFSLASGLTVNDALLPASGKMLLAVSGSNGAQITQVK